MAWICGQCRNLIDNHLTACSQCGAPRSPTAMSGVGETVDPLPASDYRDLTMEGHLRAMSIWDFVFAAVFTLSGILTFAFSSALNDRADGFLGRIFESLGVFLGVGCLMAAAAYCALGYFMWRYDNIGRIVNGVLCAIGLGMNLLGSCGNMTASRGGGAIGGVFGVLITTAWGAAKLWAYFSPRAAQICTPGYRDLVARSPDLKPRTLSSPFFWIPLAAIGLVAGCGVCASAALMSSMR